MVPGDCGGAGPRRLVDASDVDRDRHRGQVGAGGRTGVGGRSGGHGRAGPGPRAADRPRRRPGLGARVDPHGAPAQRGGGARRPPRVGRRRRAGPQRPHRRRGRRRVARRRRTGAAAPAAAARQVPVSLLVVLSAVASNEGSQAGRRALDTLLGAAVGIAVSLVLPASRLVDARQTLHRLADGLEGVLDDDGFRAAAAMVHRPDRGLAANGAHRTRATGRPGCRGRRRRP